MGVGFLSTSSQESITEEEETPGELSLNDIISHIAA
jgi:hypothetical protein